MHILKPGITWSPDGNQLQLLLNQVNLMLIIFLISKQIKEIKRFDIKGIFRPTWHPTKI